VHLLANRELTASMRQFRLAAGVGAEETVAFLNETIHDLYGDVRPAPRPGEKRQPRGRSPSVPEEMTAKFVERIERGMHGRIDHVYGLKWLENTDQLKGRANASRVPAWLVRAYDVAFGADGYLIDMYTWSVALQGDQMRDLPRRVRDLPARVEPGSEYDFLTRDLGDPDEDLRPLLREQAEQLAELAARQRTSRSSWTPLAADASGFLGEAEHEAPEGTIAAPGGMLVARFVLHNVGEVPWQDRVLYRVGPTSVGLASAPLVPIPATKPSGTADVRCVLRAPLIPGTYRVCLKMGWPDGTYCFPTTLLGLLLTVVVPPTDIADPYEEWMDHAG
jgi:hypothetical protein